MPAATPDRPATSSRAGEAVALRRARRACAGGGLVAIATLPLADERPSANLPGTIAVVLLAAAAVLLLVETRRTTSRANAAPSGSSGRVRRLALTQSSVRAHRASLAAVTLLPALAAQTWFGLHGAVAFGDVVPPNGTAWLAHIFDPLQWTGSALGAPGSPFGLAWGAVLWAVTSVGATAALAQRLWLTVLLAGAGLAAYGLLRALRVRPVPAAAGALVYVFNPYTVSVAGINAVYLAAMVLLPGLPAILIAAGSRLLKPRSALLLFVVASPLVGYAYENPPLLAPIACCCLLAPAAAWVRFGPVAGRRTAAVGVLSGFAMVVTSAYWWVPALEQLRVVASARLAAPGAWTWTEHRATIGNDFWLNAAWGWVYPLYFPYAHVYSAWWLRVVKYVLPLAAFGGLYAVSASDRARARLLAAAALVALVVVFVATGTRAPGSIVFDPLYSLPFGWLLREPGRFLMLTALLYGVMVALGTGALTHRQFHARSARRVHLLPLAGRVAGAAAILAAAFPLYTGALVRGPRQGFPSEHVTLPDYWTAMASFANAEPRQEAILVLPTDDFYQMPYRWYYGSDGFIPNLFSAHVVDPVGQGYAPASAELLAASRLVQRSLLSHNWRLAGRLLAALDTRQILVRGDIEYPFRKRKFVSPAALMAALARMPVARLLRREGPLQLWTIQRPAPRLPFATVNSNTPKLRSLALLPGGTPLVSSTPVQGHPSVWQLPPVASWTRRGATLVMAAKVGAAWSWHVAVLGGRLPPRAVGRAPVRLGPRLTAAASRSARDTLTVNFRDTTGASLLSDGNFRRSWGPVGDCNDQLLSAAARGLVGARVGQVSGIRSSRAVTLRAVADSACVSHALRWRRGPLLLSAEVRHLSGNQPRVCVWELGPKRCAPIVQPTSTSRWSHYQAVVKPSRGTTGLKLFLYADAPALGGTTVNQYAGIQAVSLDTAPSLVLVGTPRARPARERLVTSPYSYLSVWRARGRHVVVDGLRNGWLVSPNTKTTPRYAPARIISIAQIVALCFTLVTLTGVALLTLTDRARPRRQTRVGVPR